MTPRIWNWFSKILVEYSADRAWVLGKCGFKNMYFWLFETVFWDYLLKQWKLCVTYEDHVSLCMYSWTSECLLSTVFCWKTFKRIVCFRVLKTTWATNKNMLCHLSVVVFYIKEFIYFIYFIYLFYLRQKQLKTAYDELWGEVNFVHVFIILWSLS